MSGEKKSGLGIIIPGQSEDSGKSSKKKTVGKEAVRKAFRLPQSATEKVEVKINENAYEVVDLSLEGVGVRLPRDSFFPLTGEKVELLITFSGSSVTVPGKVIHMSPDYSDHYLCGIKFVSVKKSFSKKLESFLQANRTHLFAGKD